MSGKKREREPLTVWFVTWTTFVDNYTLRGEMPSATDGPYLFREEADAEAKLMELMRGHLTELELDVKDMKDERVRAICVGTDEEYGEAYGHESAAYVHYAYDWNIGEKTLE